MILILVHMVVNFRSQVHFYSYSGLVVVVTIKVLIIVKLWNYMFCLSAAKQEVIAKLEMNSYASINAANY